MNILTIFFKWLMLFYKSNSLIVAILLFTILCEKSFGQKVVAGYYPSWKQQSVPIEAIKTQHLTHIMHSFGYPDENGNIIVEDNFLYPQLIAEIHNEGKKVFLALGGAGQSYGFSTAVSDDSIRNTLVNNIIQFCTTYGYDGIDLDWEFPSSSSDMENLNKLVIEIKEKRPDIEITMAVSGQNYFSQYIDFTFLEPYVEWFGVMAYDITGPWSPNSGHHAPLFAQFGLPSGDSYVYYINQTRGIPSEKIVLGIPFYGYLFASSSFGGPQSNANSVIYRDIMVKLIDGWEYTWDNYAKVPYLQSPNNDQIISYENAESVRKKCDYVNNNNLAGVMIWEITHDAINGDNPLLENAGIKMLQSMGDLTAVSEIVSIDKGLKFSESDTAYVSVNATDITGAITRVELYIDNNKAGELSSEPYIFPIYEIERGLHVLKALAYNSLGIATPSDRVVFRVTNNSNATQLPYSGSLIQIPGIVESEEFDTGGDQVSYYDTTPGNAAASYSDFRLDEDVDCEPMTEGEYNVGYIIAGEWLEYSVIIDSSAVYQITFNVASALDGGAFHLEIDSIDVTGTIQTPGTNGWGNYEFISKTDVNLPKGEHILKFYAEKSDFNIDKMIFQIQDVVDVDDTPDLVSYELNYNYPNPFNPSTVIEYSIKEKGKVNLEIFDALGRIVAKLVDGNMRAGKHSVKFNASNLTSGIYYYQLRAGDFVKTKKMAIVK